ncbi:MULTISPECIES: hypothetical protein [Bacteroidales]|jgi:hypothetical protein|uniref:hypothetical protein n=1 Tax=Bacteroidales TaxID=171549 RepID=UPI00189B16F4|nr:hypothetical protein [Phocaeicola massiliensis]
MNRKEFEERTRRLITDEDYRLVENLYLAAGNMDKDEFCDEMRRMCAYDAANDHIELRECLKEIGRRVGAKDAELSFLKRRVESEKMELAEFLVGKACAYEDSDFYRQAVVLVGQREVTRMKLEMDLPLWNEDKEYIKENLK